MITPYTAQQPVTDYSLRFPGIVYATLLAANVEQNFTVPGAASKYKAVFSFTPNSAVWVGYNKTATVAPVAFASHNSEMNPLCREVNAGDVLSFITLTAAGAEVSISLFAVGTNN